MALTKIAAVEARGTLEFALRWHQLFINCVAIPDVHDALARDVADYEIGDRRKLVTEDYVPV